MLGEENPAAIVIDRPAKGLLREPGPALVGIHPAAPGVGPPDRICPQFRRLPDESILPGLEPLPEPGELREEDLVVPGVQQGCRNRVLDCYRLPVIRKRFNFPG